MSKTQSFHLVTRLFGKKQSLNDGDDYDDGFDDILGGGDKWWCSCTGFHSLFLGETLGVVLGSGALITLHNNINQQYDPITAVNQAE